ncbi:unnamed protein product [Caenorhabditis nigoni]
MDLNLGLPLSSDASGCVAVAAIHLSTWTSQQAKRDPCRKLQAPLTFELVNRFETRSVSKSLAWLPVESTWTSERPKNSVAPL